MGRFDNYIDSQKAAEQEKTHKQGIEKLEKDLLWESRRNEYIPLIKKALLELNDVLPKIKKWESHNEEIIKSVLGIKRTKFEPRQVIALYAFGDGPCKSGYWIEKHGGYYTTKRVTSSKAEPILMEISIDETAEAMFKNLPWDSVKYGYTSRDERTNEIVAAMRSGNAEEAVYKCFEKAIEGKV